MEAKQDHSEVPVKDQELQCTIDGCKQSFPIDGHCSVHTKKHDLSLNLQMPQKGPGGGGLFADQTPTPTRLIGKCEEVGLFEDLQKVNPFDETFRLAVESGASSLSPLIEDQSPQIPLLSAPFRPVEGETLHTPHIFPSVIDRSTLLERMAVDGVGGESATVSKQPRTKAKATSGTTSRGKQQQVEQVSSSTTASSSLSARKEPKTPKKSPVKRKVVAPMVDILPKPVAQPPPTVTTIPLIIIPSDPSATKLIPVEGNVMVKEKLKEHLTKVRDPPVPLKDPVSLVDKKLVKRSEDKPETASKVAKSIDLTNSSDGKANLKQERWKEAAKRYRVRQKNDQDQLRKRNAELEDENLQLRTQLTAFRNAHRNCNVTRTQNAAKLVQGASQAVAIAGRSVQQQEAILLNTIEQQQPVLVLQDQQQQQLQQEQPVPPLIVSQQRLMTSHIIDSMQQLQQEQPPPLSIPQQRLITSHIIDSNSFNRMPVFIVMGQGASQTLVPVAQGSALEEGSG